MMEIEVLTTKKKLTKSIVKQLKPATLSDMRHALSFHKTIQIGYHIRGLNGSASLKTGLFMGVNEWCIVELFEWKPSTSMTAITARNPNGRGEFIRRYETIGERDAFISAYNDIKDLCNKNHLML